MPLKKQVPTLRKASMVCLVKNWDFICYSAKNSREMAELLESDGYLRAKGPFTSFPSTVLEDLMDTIRSTRNLTRKFLHLLLSEQLLKLNLSFGVGEVYYGLEFLPRCKRLKDLSLAYLRHVEPGHFMPLISCLGNIRILNLSMTSAHDPLLRRIAECCPNLVELNLQSTFISDDGLRSLCGLEGACGAAPVPGCKALKRLIVSETRISWTGAYDCVQNLPNLTDFDFDKIFQVFEHLDPSSLSHSSRKPFGLRSLYSTTPAIRAESIDAAAILCPSVEILSVSNAWIDNDTFYKFMQFERLRTLSLFNSEGKTVDYSEGVLPILQVIGEGLENLILSKFSQVDLPTLGRSCPNLRKLALSQVCEINTNPGPPLDHVFSRLINLELWLEGDQNFVSGPILLQLLSNAVNIENIIVKKSAALDLPLLRTIWAKNRMMKLARLMLDECLNICGAGMLEWVQMENDLSTIRIWSCPKVRESDKTMLQQFFKEGNFFVYLEWFE